MKNCRFLLRHYLANGPGKFLLFALVFTFGSCQKGTVYDVPGIDVPDTPNYQSADRSSGLENDVLEYAQWMIDNMVPIVKDPLVYEDIKAGNYATERVKAKISEMGFNDFADFAGQLTLISGNIKEALQSGAISSASLEQMLQGQMSNLDLTTLVRSGRSIGPPCYNQLIHHLALVGAEIAIASAGGPITATIAGVIGVAAAYIDFKDCLDENYPR